MVDRIDRLSAEHHRLSQSQVRHLLTGWDKDQGGAMIHSERQLRIPPKLYQWSPKLRNAGIIKRYWRLRLKELTHNFDSSETFDRWESSIQGYDRSFSLPEKGFELDVATVRLALHIATKRLHTIQANSRSIRQRSYEDLLATYDADSNTSTKAESARKARIVNRTMQSEACRNTFRNIRNIVKPTETAALSRLEIPRDPADAVRVTPPGEVHSVLLATNSENLIWDTVIERHDIEAHLLAFNKEAFRAASESPCGNGVIHDALRFTSLSQAAEDLLYGNVPAHWYGDNHLLREFLASFTTPATVLAAGPISLTISGDNIKKGIRSWAETTSTSPSGRHLGHYKRWFRIRLFFPVFKSS